MIDPTWIDDNGLLRPRLAMSDSGNGILYLTMLMAIRDAVGEPLDPVDVSYVNLQLTRCTIEPGLFKRTPDGSYGPETWDDYQGMVTWCIVTNNTAMARSVFWYGVKHLGIYDEDFLWRTVQVFWGLLIVAAYPWLSLPMRPLLWAYGTQMNAEIPRVYLDWLYFYGASKRGYTSPKLATLSAQLSTSLKYEMDVINPAVLEAEKLILFQTVDAQPPVV